MTIKGGFIIWLTKFVWFAELQFAMRTSIAANAGLCFGMMRLSLRLKKLKQKPLCRNELLRFVRSSSPRGHFLKLLLNDFNLFDDNGNFRDIVIPAAAACLDIRYFVDNIKSVNDLSKACILSVKVRGITVHYEKL